MDNNAEFTVIPMKSLNTSLNFCKNLTVKYFNYVVWLYRESVSVNAFCQYLIVKCKVFLWIYILQWKNTKKRRVTLYNDSWKRFQVLITNLIELISFMSVYRKFIKVITLHKDANALSLECENKQDPVEIVKLQSWS